MEDLLMMHSIVRSLAPKLTPMMLPKSIELDVEKLVSTEEQKGDMHELIMKRMKEIKECKICCKEGGDLMPYPVVEMDLNSPSRVCYLTEINFACLYCYKLIDTSSYICSQLAVENDLNDEEMSEQYELVHHFLSLNGHAADQNEIVQKTFTLAYSVKVIVSNMGFDLKLKSDVPLPLSSSESCEKHITGLLFNKKKRSGEEKEKSVKKKKKEKLMK